jgi:exopolyphosphatase/guanosine-5'-triphosphate,3'-diphosphate pyrophosphatase
MHRDPSDGAGTAPVAALDCGTNSTRVLIVDGSGSVLERHMRITRLGEGVDATRALAPEAIARTVDALADFRRLMDHHGVGRARLVATSAVRDAQNAHAFLEAAERVTAVVPEVLSGLEEGRLSFAGATATLPAGHGAGPVLVVDIGGGSTELAAGVPGEPGHPMDDVAAISLDVGCVRLSERYLAHDPPRAEELASARAAVDVALDPAGAVLPPLEPGGLLVGLAGTVSTLASLAQGLAAYDRDRIHHFELSRHDVGHWLELLAADDHAARLARPGMVPGREDVIVGGVLVLDAVMEDFDRERCLVSEDDILDGLVASLRAPDGG